MARTQKATVVGRELWISFSSSLSTHAERRHAGVGNELQSRLGSPLADGIGRGL